VNSASAAQSVKLTASPNVQDPGGAVMVNGGLSVGAVGGSIVWTSGGGARANVIATHSATGECGREEL
jgi:hypothetical protein